MAIGTYAELQTAVANYLDRSDLTSEIPDFIAAGEARLYDDLKIRAMETDLSDTLSSGDRSITYPSDCLRLKSALYLTDSSSNLQPLIEESVEWMLVNYPSTASTTTGQPSSFCIKDGKIYFNVIADDDYAITGVYYKRLTLSDSATTNWLLTNYPMAYLYATLIESTSFVEDDPRRWEAMYEEQLRRIRRRNTRERFAASGRTMSQVNMPGASTVMG